MEKIELFSPGSLGTCWYGKYHYLEPWAGCEHDCDYCYARYRSPVQNSLQSLHTSFAEPAPLMEPERLLTAVRDRLSAGDIKTLKLSRFTDIFSPKFVKNGLMFRLLEVLVNSSVNRIIITTKGSPDEACLKLMARYPAKISYNVVAKPPASVCLERQVAPLEDRLNAAQFLREKGVLTTIHMDPLVPGLEDDENDLRAFFDRLAKKGLKRVMFSLLLLLPEMIEDMKQRHDEESVKKILSVYDLEKSRQFLPKQGETVYVEVRSDVKKVCFERISTLLREMKFEFVLCSLKNLGKDVKIDPKLCPICDGSFYA